jgi:hypothetical protein
MQFSRDISTQEVARVTPEHSRTGLLGLRSTDTKRVCVLHGSCSKIRIVNIQANGPLTRSRVRTHDVRLRAKSVISLPPDGPNELWQAFNYLSVPCRVLSKRVENELYKP